MNILKRIYRSIKYRLRMYYENISYTLKIIYPLNMKKIYVLNTPLHRNVGDSAIAYAENVFLEKFNKREFKIVEVTSGELHRYRRILYSIIRPKDILALHGGGNMGIEWFEEEIERRKLIEYFQNNKIIVFPQTIYYGDSDKGREEFENSKKIYNAHNNLHLIAREKTSYEIMKRAYTNCNVILTPDIVLSLERLNNPFKREKITFCFRRDVEKTLLPEDEKHIINECKKISDNIYYTDMMSDEEITKSNRIDIINDKFKEFQKSKLVITDRLHGMVLCAISETPCIVFSNYNHKVKGTYEWIADLPYIKFVENINEGINAINDLMNIKECKFDNSKFQEYFNSITKEINNEYK